MTLVIGLTKVIEPCNNGNYNVTEQCYAVHTVGPCVYTICMRKDIVQVQMRDFEI